jgi:peptidoglycan/xylan/chitin deacetylase (PgdA/CDA1 family)
MFHSVGAGTSCWPYNYLSEAIEQFERKISFLVRKHYHFLFHDDLYSYMRGGTSLPEKCVLLTFDDGFLDNWVIVYPILKKYGARFTIYVSQEFVDPANIRRQTLEDVWSKKIGYNQLRLLGYLSWDEMAEMERSGLVDIQSHTSTHTWHFTGRNIIDFVNPKNIHEYPWVAWNNNKEIKPTWVQDWDSVQKNLLGLPVYENKRAMIAVKYNEPEAVKEAVRDYVNSHGGKRFFDHGEWRTLLFDVANACRKRRIDRDTFEDEKERAERLRYELLGNRLELGRRLGKEVRYLCWPGGAYNEHLIKIADECGYWATTVKEGRNAYGDDPRKVHRISSGNLAAANRFPWKYTLFTLNYYIARFQRKIWALGLDKIYRLKNS